jgi:hypothetical protein
LRDQVSGITVFSSSIINSSGTGGAGNKYVIIPYHFFDTSAFSEYMPYEPRRLYRVHPVGIRTNNRQKVFRRVEIYAKGKAVMLVRLFVDNKTTYEYQKTVTFSDDNQYIRKFVDFPSPRGKFCYVEISFPKADELLIVERLAVWYRELGMLRI